MASLASFTAGTRRPRGAQDSLLLNRQMRLQETDFHPFPKAQILQTTAATFPEAGKPEAKPI